ncbi:LppU/SCO3897 family protein [Actinoplanes sp. CA-051413]|uniref:LppU/SCO3897 family protein n=1 Tax=Actinoplanes sp. CA-051413 TaxID=3239899 RepID=UPI003D97D22C
MSQNGPYPGQGWSAGGPPGSDEPYTEPADPWGDAATHSSPVPETAWGGQPMSVPPSQENSAGFHGGYPVAPMNGVPPVWQQPPAPPPRKRNTPIIALVVVLALLIIGGLATAGWLVQRAGNTEAGRSAQPTASASATNGSVPEPQSSEDARFVGKGQCVRNEGTADDSPDLKIVVCASGTYQVLKRVDGRTTGEADAESKCSKVQKYTKWYFYDSELDSLDFVLCLKEYGVD